MVNPISVLLTVCIRAYQVVLSPLFTGCCRFEPSCSNYGLEAVRVHGAARGFLLTCARLLRCRPFGPHGYDPVPAPGCWREGLWLRRRIEMRGVSEEG